MAYISNNSFIDVVAHRQMRKNLMQTFDKIYILDLHGNSKKKEVALDGGKDENVFDIMQGVSIMFFCEEEKVIKVDGKVADGNFDHGKGAKEKVADGKASLTPTCGMVRQI